MNLDVGEDEIFDIHFETMNENPIGEPRRRGVRPGLKRGKYKRMGKEKERVLEAAQDGSGDWRAVATANGVSIGTAYG